MITLGLTDALPPELGEIDVWRQVGSHARALHDGGYLHRDLHRGNILASGKNGSRKACFLDLQKMRHVGRVPMRFRAVELAGLVRSLDDKARAALLASYSTPGRDAASLQQRVEASPPRLTRLRVRSRSKRCLMNSTQYRVDRQGFIRVFRRADAPFEDAVRAVDLHERVLRGEPCEFAVVIHRRSRTNITKQAWSGPTKGHVAVKSYAGGCRESVLSLFGTHRGRRAWRAAHMLALTGVNAPRHLALVERLRGGLVFKSAVVMRWSGETDVVSHANALIAAGEGSRLEAVASALAAFIGRVHALGIYHEDLKPRNIVLTDTDQPAAPPKLMIVDWEAVRQRRVLTWRRRLKNLAQPEDYAQAFLPDLGLVHRRRFIAACLRANPELKTRRRADLVEVRRMTANRAARRRRNATFLRNGSKRSPPGIRRPLSISASAGSLFKNRPRLVSSDFRCMLLGDSSRQFARFRHEPGPSSIRAPLPERQAPEPRARPIRFSGSAQVSTPSPML